MDTRHCSEICRKDNLNKLHRPNSRTLPPVLHTYLRIGAALCVYRTASWVPGVSSIVGLHYMARPEDSTHCTDFKLLY